MKTNLLVILSVLLSVCSLRAQEEAPQPIPGQYIVLLKQTAAAPVVLSEVQGSDGEATSAMNQQKRDQNLTALKQLRAAAGIDEARVLADYADVVVGFAAGLSDAEVRALEQNANVEGVYQDYSYSLGLPQEETPPGEFVKAGQTTPCAITNVGGSADGSGKSTRIWILDTGINLNHPDLNVVTAAPYAKSFITGQTVEDGNGHGTHVSGIAAAKNNSFGTVGVSAGAKVVPVKILNNAGSGTWSSILSGLNHVAQYDIVNDVVNMSLGGYPLNNCANANPSIRTAILNLGMSGTWVCMAAGNDGADAAYNFPGCINGTKILTVGAMNCDKSCAPYSNWRSTVVDWAATGTNVYSTYKNGTYATLSGTSMATPVVAGIVHARAGAPVSGGTITCGNGEVPSAVYKIAKRI